MKCIIVYVLLVFGLLMMSIGDLIICKYVCGYVIKITKNLNLLWL